MVNVKSSGPVILTTSNVRDDETDRVTCALVDYVQKIKVHKSTLDGSLTVTASLDAPSTWANGIFENSRHFRVNVDLDGKMTWTTFVWSREHGTTKARACRVKSLDAFVEKVRAYVASVPAR
jgi:hypothetical protein